MSRDFIRSLGIAGLLLAVGCLSAEPDARPATTPVYGYQVIHAYPHDADAYTQGLIYRDGFLFESTGLNGRSSVRKVALETGEVVQRRAVEQTYFAEGLTDWKSSLVQLTWQSHVGFVYDLTTFQLRDSFPLTGEGWGLTHDDATLIVSDGSDVLRFLDPESHRELRRVAVSDAGMQVKELNELEFVRGEVYANVWHTDRVAMISPQSGTVTGWIDLRGLMSVGYRLAPEAVLNGIAFDAAGNRLFVTGKLWPTLFEIRVVGR